MKSSRPSELKSPGTIPNSSMLPGRLTAVWRWNVPSPLPLRIAKVGLWKPSLKYHVMKSVLPSEVKSPAVNAQSVLVVPAW